MLQKHIENSVRKHFAFDFSASQKTAVEAFLAFLIDGREESLFVLKGYAGTGKTSLIAAIIKALTEHAVSVVLLAPTGRAAKVFSAYAGVQSYTIHKKIYRQKATMEGEGNFTVGYNKSGNTLFFVDEASMISNSGTDSNFGSGHVLDDLIEYVYNGRNNRLVLIGDLAQLPPVGVSISPALDVKYLQSAYHFDVSEVNMTEIMRQEELSGILYNATSVRNMIGTGETALLLKAGTFPDIFRISGAELLEELDGCYGKFGLDETMVICYSNKRANKFNEGIRRMVLYREDEFSGGDKIMVVKNNYFWGRDKEEADFIANGEIATVLKVKKQEELYGVHFANADIAIAGYEELNVWLILDTLRSDASALSQEENRMLYRNVEADYSSITSRKKRFEKIRENKYYNALQIKFAYAVTGHKAQGGQWDAIFIDQGWLPQEMLNDNYWRWLYTAITRARKRLYFVNFKNEFF